MAEIKMTEEIREKMLGLLPFDNEATVEYTPYQFKVKDFPEEYVPVFTQRPYKEGEIKKGGLNPKPSQPRPSKPPKGQDTPKQSSGKDNRR